MRTKAGIYLLQKSRPTLTDPVPETVCMVKILPDFLT